MPRGQQIDRHRQLSFGVIAANPFSGRDGTDPGAGDLLFVGHSAHRPPAPYLLQGLGRCRLLHAGSFYLGQLAQAALVSRLLRRGKGEERSDSGSGARNRLQLEPILPRAEGIVKAGFLKKTKNKGSLHL